MVKKRKGLEDIYINEEKFSRNNQRCAYKTVDGKKIICNVCGSVVTEFDKGTCKECVNKKSRAKSRVHVLGVSKFYVTRRIVRSIHRVFDLKNIISGDIEFEDTATAELFINHIKAERLFREKLSARERKRVSLEKLSFKINEYV